MKKRLLVILATLILTFAFATTCFAAQSPGANTLPEKESNTGGGSGDGDKDKDKDKEKNRNTGSTSPKTGMDTTVPMIALITAAGVMLISKKEFSKAD